MTIKQTTGHKKPAKLGLQYTKSDEELAPTNTLDSGVTSLSLSLGCVYECGSIAPEVNSITPTLPVEGRRKRHQAGDSKSLYARDTVPGCRVGDATSAGWLKTGAASAASVGVWTRSGLVVDSKADGSLVANTAATVVRSGTLWHTISSDSTGTNHAQCFANA